MYLCYYFVVKDICSPHEEIVKFFSFYLRQPIQRKMMKRVATFQQGN